jgi:GTPase SAR1 family protein/uncharacterized protein YbcI
MASSQKSKKIKSTLKKYKSELDQLPIEIKFGDEDLKIEIKTGIDETNWWKQIGLTGNPYPSDQGLVGIPKELYDQVIVRTKFVNGYLTRVENNPEEFLGQSIVVTGEFGSGKTTLLNMICYKLGTQGILPCKIIIIPSPDADAMTNELLKQLGVGLGKIITNMSGIEKRFEYGVIDSLSKLSLILRDFKKYEGKGLVISIDGLHKGTKYFPQTLEFLQQLQNIHEFIEQEEVSCGFLLAGSLFWEKEIRDGASLSGSISKIDIIPPLSEEDAVEAVLRRIQSFSPPGKSAPTIKKESIRIAFRTLQQRTGKQITFRSFMNHIRDRLIVGSYDEVGIGVSSHYEIVDTIIKFVKSSEIGGNYEAIEREILKAPNLRKILQEVLLKIYQWRGIEESNRLFRTYIKVFNLLRLQGFIVQRKSTQSGPFVWGISPSLAKILSGIQVKYSIPAEDALSCIFESRKTIISKEKDTIYSNIISKMTQSAASLRDSWPTLARKLEDARGVIKKVETQIVSENLKTIDSLLLSDTCNLLVTCVLEAGGIKIKEDTENSKILQNFWCSPENVDEIIEFCERTRNRLTSDSEVFGLLHHHAGILEQLIDLVSELTQREGISRLTNRRLVNEDMKIIHKARNSFINQSYKETVDIICTLLEDKVRDIGFTIIRAIWGDEMVKIIPSDMRGNLSKIDSRGHPRTKRPLEQNFFYDLSRSEYGKILFQKQFRAVIFGKNLNTTDFDQMKNMWELAFSLGDREAHGDKPSYFREHATEVADVLRILPLMCERFLVIVERLLQTMKFKYEKSGKFIIGKYDLDEETTCTSVTISMENKNVQRILKTILSSIDRNPRDAIPLDRILIVEGEPIENQVAIINAIINRDLMNLHSNMYLEITEKGKKILSEITGEHNIPYEV